MYVFCIFLFAPVQRNSACSTWKGALEICSLLLFLLLLLNAMKSGLCQTIRPGLYLSTSCISLQSAAMVPGPQS